MCVTLYFAVICTTVITYSALVDGKSSLNALCEELIKLINYQ